MFYLLDPEVAGHIGKQSKIDWSCNPPRIDDLHCEFDSWEGNELVACGSCFLLSASLAQQIRELDPSGCLFEPVLVTASRDFAELEREGLLGTITAPRPLPSFEWIVVTGKPTFQDFGLTSSGELVVSERVLDELLSTNMNCCDVDPYDPN